MDLYMALTRSGMSWFINSFPSRLDGESLRLLCLYIRLATLRAEREKMSYSAFLAARQSWETGWANKNREKKGLTLKIGKLAHYHQVLLYAPCMLTFSCILSVSRVSAQATCSESMQSRAGGPVAEWRRGRAGERLYLSITTAGTVNLLVDYWFWDTGSASCHNIILELCNFVR